MRYFAYGSNLDADQMRERCRNPGLAPAGRALLPDHRLAFTRHSPIRNGGVADILPAAGRQVWGCLYDLSSEEIDLLDEFEGVPRVYRHHTVEVWLDGDPLLREEVLTYTITTKATPEPPPHPDYLRQILRGAREVGLPEKYIANLAQIGSSQIPA